MMKFNRTTVTFATVIPSLGFVAAGDAPASAHQGRVQATAHAPMHRHVVRSLLRPGYAGPASASKPGTVWMMGPILDFVPAHGIVDGSCDLPTSACSNDERIAN
jgi:hypothetical protein